MATQQTMNVSRRERQILEILFRLGRATAAEVHREMEDAPSYSAVRAHLRTLEDKGHARHEAEDLRYVYMPTAQPARARRGALRHMVDTFFGGSPARAAAALLDGRSARMSEEELDGLAALIERARKEER
ncbi:MAG: BlaI/MecI/CopY family transcriptional regulator [Candidatus Solibacter usitatus]|nr:BlaI/MecI/CopY family transcriptional regulator [Candidatus Solibacter usitatus]